MRIAAELASKTASWLREGESRLLEQSAYRDIKIN